MSQRAKRSASSGGSASSDQTEMTPLFPSIPIDQVSSIEVSVHAVVDGVDQLVPLQRVGQATRLEEIQKSLGGGNYEFQAYGDNDAKIPHATRSVSLPGAALWKESVEQAIADQHFNSESIVQQQQQPPYGAPYGMPPYGQPGMMPGMPGQPGYPGMVPPHGPPPYGMQGFQPPYGMPGFGGGFAMPQSPPIEVSTGPNGEKAIVDSQLPPAERQRRFDALEQQRRAQAEQGREMGMFGMIMQMSQANTQMLVQAMSGNRQQSSSEEVNSLRAEVARLQAALAAQNNQQQFVSNQLNQANLDLQTERNNSIRNVREAEAAANARTAEVRIEVQGLRNELRQAEVDHRAKVNALEAENLNLKRANLELEAKMRGDGKVNMQGIVEAVAGIGGVVAGVATDVMKAQQQNAQAQAQNGAQPQQPPAMAPPGQVPFSPPQGNAFGMPGPGPGGGSIQ